ncbi:MAG: acyl-CoA thioester hydrolase [Actinomycetota bacterium]|nr:acyl-CoA thioester hydrolase [Actinomycetota bacterium]
MPALRTSAQVRWSDMDALGHVHNAAFLQYFELGRAAMVLSLLDVPHHSTASLVVRRHEIDYLRPLIYRPEPVAVDTWVDRVGTTSFTLAGQVREPEGEVVYARIATVLVAVDTGTGAAVTIGDPIRRALAGYLADDVA